MGFGGALCGPRIKHGAQEACTWTLCVGPHCGTVVSIMHTIIHPCSASVVSLLVELTAKSYIVSMVAIRKLDDGRFSVNDSGCVCPPRQTTDLHAVHAPVA
jgi:hypothetical protein